jgi:uncharacterized protein
MHTRSAWRWLAIGWLALHACASQGAQLAIIIDDLGYNLRLGEQTARLSGAFTLAVLPFTPHGRALAELAHRQGKEVMLHAPMSNRHNYPLGQGGLTAAMDKHQFLAVLRRNLANVPHIKGVNNHMGSQLTELAEPMGWLMAELQARQLYFVDSRTSANTQALAAAERINLPSRKRDVFLDDTRHSQHILSQLLLAISKAKQQGSAVAIGHPYPETLAVLGDIQPLLKQHNVQLVPVSALIPSFRQRALPQSSCLAPPPGLWPRTWAPIDPFDAKHLPFTAPALSTSNYLKPVIKNVNLEVN